MKTKPKTWTLSDDENGFFIHSTANGGKRLVCHIYKDRPEDAKLIASAPEMLEALRFAAIHLGPAAPNCGERCWEAMEMVDKAIEKATT